MRTRAIRLLILAVVCLASSLAVPPTAQALPRDEVIINYYNCSWYQVAQEWRDCFAQWHYDGSTSGARYRETIVSSCQDGSVSEYTLEQRTFGGGWEPYTGESEMCDCIYLHSC